MPEIPSTAEAQEAAVCASRTGILSKGRHLVSSRCRPFGTPPRRPTPAPVDGRTDTAGLRTAPV